MDYQGEFTIKYHHGGSLIKGRYCNGRMDEFCVDPDKLCHWDLLEDLKELGHDITKSMDFYYKDSEGSFKLICDDGGILGLVNQIKKFWTSDIYVQSSCGDQQHTLPKVLVNDIVSPGNVDVSVHNVLELDEDDNMNASVGGNFNGNQNLNGDGSGNVIENANDSGNESNSSKEDEEGLIDVPFIDYCSEVDDETENARGKLRKYLQMEKEMKGNNEDDVDSDDDNATEDAFRSEGQPNVAETGQNIDNVKATSEKDEMIGHESDYIDSDDPGSYDDTSDGSDADDARRHKSNKMIYDPTRPLDDFCLDLRFEDLKAFKNELIEFSTKRGLEFKFIKNDSTRVRAKCAAKECKWLIFCSWCSGKKMFVVKHYVADHSCLLGVPKNRRVTAPLIAKKFGEVISSMLSMKARQLRAMVRAQLGVFVTYKVCRNAKNLVIKKIEEQFIEDFKLLNNYALELKSTNPGSTVVVMAENGNPNELPVFQKIYICLHAVKEGFLGGCRRIIGLDGCFLKGLLKGQLLVAVGRDGNNQMFPVAWAVVQKETSETWGWFIENLKSDLCMGEGLGWSLISDMQKGLINAVTNLLPFVEHRMCARHIYARWGKKHQGRDLQLQFWNIARSTNQPEVRKNLEQLSKMKGGDAAMEELLQKWPIQGWCQAYFSDAVKCEVVDNNMCEVFNGVVLDSRNKPIISMLEDIRQYVMQRIVVKRDYVNKWNGEYSPNIVAKIEKERQRSAKWLVEWNGDDKFEVFWDDLMVHERQAYVVILVEKICSCGKWGKTGIPCQHAMAAIAFRGLDVVHYVAHWFQKDTYLKAYGFVINPVKGRAFWPTSEEGPLQPPLIKKMPGRPAKKRRREPLEGKSKGKTKLSRKGIVFKCGYCHAEGHNKTTCRKRSNKMVAGFDMAKTSSQNTIGKNIEAIKNKKRPTVASSTSTTILRGTNSGGLIIGKENPHFSSFITASQLIAKKNMRNSAGKIQVGEGSQQICTSLEFEDLSTQQSVTTTVAKENA